MPIDTSLYNVLGVRPKSMMDYESEFAQQDAVKQRAQLNALALQEGQMGLAEKQRSLQDQTVLRNALAGLGANATDAQRINALKGTGLPGGFSQADALEKSMLERQKAGAEVGHKNAQTQKEQIGAAKARIDLIVNATGSARDQASYSQALQLLAANGVDVSEIPPQFDPNYVASARQQALSVKEQIEAQQREAQLAETARNNQAQNAVSQGQLRVSQGQLGVAQGNLGLRRAELEQAKAAPRGQFLETPSGYVLGDPRTGTVAPVVGPDGKQIVGKSADRALTDSQAKANLFGTRMQEADKVLGALEGKYSPMAVNAKMAAEKAPLVGGLTGFVANSMLSDQGQQVEQAQRDFINAVLRRESGAVISDQEFANGQKQYFPQPGDSKAVLEQKRRNRKSATDLMLAEVPTGKRGAGKTDAADTPATPGKVKFLGFE